MSKPSHIFSSFGRKWQKNCSFGQRKKKLSNKATLSLRLLSKCSFTISKLRFIELRKPKISSCYTTS